MTRAPATTPKRRRSREWMGVVGAFVLAGACGLVAAHFGTHQSWETPSTPTTAAVQFVDPQRTP